MRLHFKTLLAAIFLSGNLVCNFIYAQSEMTLAAFDNLYQSSYLNPAFTSDHKVSLGLPGISSIYFGVGNSGFSFNELTLGAGSNQIKLNALAGIAGKNNLLYQKLGVDIFHLRYKKGNAYLSFHIIHKQQFYWSYPADFLDFASGNFFNPDYSGKTFDLSNLKASFFHYNEYAFAYNKPATWQDKSFIYGFRFKFLQGLSNMLLSPADMKIQTGKSGEAITSNQDFVVHTSGIFSENELNKFGIQGNYFTNFKNPGLAFDAGIAVPLNKKLTVAAGLTNIGFIYWTNNTRDLNMPLKEIFNGVNASNLLLTRDFNTISLSDTIKQQFLPFISSRGSYVAWLIPGLNLNVKYSLGKKWNFQLTGFFEKYKVVRSSIALTGQLKLNRVLSLAGSASFTFNQFNTGLGLVLKPGPFQFYLLCDNLFTTYYTDPEGKIPVPLPLDSRNINIRTGINIVWGAQRNQQRLSGRRNYD